MRTTQRTGRRAAIGLFEQLDRRDVPAPIAPIGGFLLPPQLTPTNPGPGYVQHIALAITPTISTTIRGATTTTTTSSTTTTTTHATTTTNQTVNVGLKPPIVIISNPGPGFVTHINF